jgi:hypothetical protein
MLHDAAIPVPIGDLIVDEEGLKVSLEKLAILSLSNHWTETTEKVLQLM